MTAQAGQLMTGQRAAAPPPATKPDPWANNPRIRRRLVRLSRLLDAAVRVPGTKFEIGLDGAVGLLPVVGNAITTAVSVYILVEARRAGVPLKTLSRMLTNVVVDTTIGTVPVIGDAADFVFKSNQRNLRLMGIDHREP